MKLSELTHETEAASGKWFDFTFSDGKTQQLMIASAGTTEYQNFAAERWNSARRGRQNIPPAVVRRIIVDGIVRHLLKNWKGNAITNDDGSPAEFNEQNVRAVVGGLSLEAQAVRDFVMETASNTSNFLEVVIEPDGEETESATPADALKSGPALAVGMGAEAPASP